MIIDGVFKNSTEQIEEYQAELRKCMYSDDNGGKFYDSLILVCIVNIVPFRSGNNNVFCSGRVRWLHSITVETVIPLGPIRFHYCTIANRRSVTYQRIRYDSPLFAELQSTKKRWSIFSISGILLAFP